MKYLYQLIILILCAFSARAQKVTVSQDISIREDMIYDVLGELEDRILLYKQRGQDREVDVFDLNLKYLYDQPIELEDHKTSIYAIVPQKNNFTIYYGYRDKKKFYLKAKKYDKTVNLIDSTTLINGAFDFPINQFQYDVSEDRSKTLLFATKGTDVLTTYVLDNDSLSIVWDREHLIPNYNLRKQFRAILVTNLGEVNALFEIDNSKFSRDNHRMVLLGFDWKEGFYQNFIEMNDIITVDFEFDFDNKNRRIILAGLYAEESEYNADGYFYLNEPISLLEETTVVETVEFDLELLEELYGKKLGRKKRLNDFVTRNLILRDDGGFLLFTEMNKEYFRRSNFRGISGTGAYGGQGWVDIYNEEIIVFSLNSDGSEAWKKIFYKKQFSQDDGGIFSSYFLFKTPSRIRLIYNDEIKESSTVSEYVMDPIGNYERNSLMSTEYQNLKLRFKNALQVANNALIVPSEKNLTLNLVKIEY